MSVSEGSSLRCRDYKRLLQLLVQFHRNLEITSSIFPAPQAEYIIFVSFYSIKNKVFLE